MAKSQRITFVVLAAAAAVAGLVDAVTYVSATASLARATSLAGFDALDIANHLAIAVAVLAALAAVVCNLGARRLAVPAFSLLLVSGITALIAGGLYSIGTTLFHAASVSIRADIGSATPGSPILQLYSLISAVMGSGYVLAPVPVVFAVAAVLVPLLAVARSVNIRRTVTTPITA